MDWSAVWGLEFSREVDDSVFSVVDVSALAAMSFSVLSVLLVLAKAVGSGKRASDRVNNPAHNVLTSFKGASYGSTHV